VQGSLLDTERIFNRQIDGASQDPGDGVRRGLADQPGEAGMPFTLVW